MDWFKVANKVATSATNKLNQKMIEIEKEADRRLAQKQAEYKSYDSSKLKEIYTDTSRNGFERKAAILELEKRGIARRKNT